MLGLFRRNFKEFDHSKYYLIAVSASANALAVTMQMLAECPRRDEKTFMVLYNEVLAFAVCLAQMRIQKRYKLNSGDDVLTIIAALQQQFREFPAPETILPGQDLAVTRNMLENATTYDFFERVSQYAARDYNALAITDEALVSFCKVTKQNPSIIKGAGWTMALLVFQIRTSVYLLSESEFPQRLQPMLRITTEGCRFMMDNLDRLIRR